MEFVPHDLSFRTHPNSCAYGMYNRKNWDMNTKFAQNSPWETFWHAHLYLGILTDKILVAFFFLRMWSTWNGALHKFLKENMQAGISNMEDNHELIVWNNTYAFRVRMTIVLIQKTIIQVCTKARSSCILTKVVWKCHKIIPPI